MKTRMMMTGFVMMAFVLLTACSDDDADSNGRVKVYLTDAPIDGGNVDALFLSVTRIEMKGSGDWKTVKTFDTPLSIDILDYQNGSAFFVTEETLKADTYTEARLILKASEEGSSPSANPDCFIRFADGTKKELFVPSGGQSGYKVKGAFTVTPNTTNEVTLDFDARKSIVATGSGKLLLKPTVRLVSNKDAATLDGSFAEHNAYSKIVVYAYEKGTFEASESAAPATGEARFKNAISSQVVASDGNFTMAFMSPGDYDLIIAAHNTDGEFVDVIGKYENVKLNSGARLDLDISLSLLVEL